MGMEKCLFIIFMLGMKSVWASNECKTQNNEFGVCLNIDDCPILLSQVQKSENTTLIKKSFCGVKDRKIKVCCPLAGVLSNLDQTVLPTQTTCGKRNFTGLKIIGGDLAGLMEFPWMAALGYRNMSQENSGSLLTWKCGGSLISRRHVLTAAHCVQKSKFQKLTVVRLGELNLNSTVKDGASPLDVPIKLVIQHEKFNFDLRSNDIALIKLSYNVNYNEFIQPICLPITEKMINQKLESKLLAVAGWGYTGYSSNTALMRVDIPITNESDCKKAYEYFRSIINNDKQLCAGAPNEGKDSCQGDSGGPLMWNEKSQTFVMGIVSYGPYPCSKPGIPGVYTRVSPYIYWIVKKVKEN